MGLAGAGCVVCGGSETEIVSRRDRHGRPLITVLCGGCGLLRNDPVPSQEELDRFYRRDYRREYKGASEPRLRQVWRNFDRLTGHVRAFEDIYARGGEWLDLGAGSGEFSFLAGRMGARVIPVEPNQGYAAYCQRVLDLAVQAKTLEDCDFAPGSFDLIRLSHVLEHMRDPVAALKRLRGWLRPGGVLYIEVPDIEADASNKLQGRMFHYGHIHNFNPVTLRHVAGRAGLVELAATAERSAGRCGAFFAAGEGGLLPEAALRENAARMRVAMEAHQARRLPRPRGGSALGALADRIARRLREAWAGRRLGSHRGIAEAAAARLPQVVHRAAPEAA